MGHILNNVRLMVMDKLCTDVILGLNILSQHEKLAVHFGGSTPPVLIKGAGEGGLHQNSLKIDFIVVFDRGE